MVVNKSRSDVSCQLTGLASGTRSLTLQDRARQLLLRMLSAVERRARRWNLRLRDELHEGVPPHASSGLDNPPRAVRDAETGKAEEFHPGEVVQVLPLEEIRRTLDERAHCDGLEFMESMAEHCGQDLVVMKRVHYLYDEGERRMLRVKRPRYILEGAICRGTNAYDREGCDRSCFYFWSPRWLRRMDR
jgi:hypothetical protein